MKVTPQTNAKPAVVKSQRLVGKVSPPPKGRRGTHVTPSRRCADYDETPRRRSTASTPTLVPLSVTPTEPFHFDSAEVVILIVAGTKDGVAQPSTWINALESTEGRMALQIYSPNREIHEQLQPYTFVKSSRIPHIEWGSLKYALVVMEMFKRALSLFKNAKHFFVANGTSVMLVDGPGLLRAMRKKFFRTSHVGIGGHVPVKKEHYPRLAEAGHVQFYRRLSMNDQRNRRAIICGQQSGQHFIRRDLVLMVDEWAKNATLYRKINKLYLKDVMKADWRDEDPDFRHPPCPKDVIPEEYMLQTVYLYVAHKRGQKVCQDSPVWCSYERMQSVKCPCCHVRHVNRSKVLVSNNTTCRQLFNKRCRSYVFDKPLDDMPDRNPHHMLFMRKVCPCPFLRHYPLPAEAPFRPYLMFPVSWHMHLQGVRREDSEPGEQPVLPQLHSVAFQSSG